MEYVVRHLVAMVLFQATKIVMIIILWQEMVAALHVRENIVAMVPGKCPLERIVTSV
jgi:hypothetical protein